MNQGESKRLGIFEKYSANLHFLNENGLIPRLVLKFDRTYICPGCMRQFSIDDLDTKLPNHLTLEDVPPKSLGGKPTILTCKECNNNAGVKIDSQLYSRMFEMDKRNFIPGTSFHARFKQDGKIVQGEVTVDIDGTINVKHSYKKNQKDQLDKFIVDISPKTGNPIMNIEFYPSKLDSKRLQVALLKTAYLQCFEKYGYLIITNPIYDIVREQIKNPDDDIYPMQFWFTGPFREEHEGVHFVVDEGHECLMSVFSLRSQITRTFAAILPIKETPIIQVVAGFHASFAMNVNYTATFRRFDDPEGYLSSIDPIKPVLEMLQILKQRT